MIFKLELRPELGLIVDTNDGWATLGKGDSWNANLERVASHFLLDALAKTPRQIFADADPKTLNFGPEFYFGRPVSITTTNGSRLIAMIFDVLEERSHGLVSGPTISWNPPTPQSFDAR